jgi:hypothetical protein
MEKKVPTASETLPKKDGFESVMEELLCALLKDELSSCCAGNQMADRPQPHATWKPGHKPGVRLFVPGPVGLRSFGFCPN